MVGPDVRLEDREHTPVAIDRDLMFAAAGGDHRERGMHAAGVRMIRPEHGLPDRERSLGVALGELQLVLGEPCARQVVERARDLGVLGPERGLEEGQRSLVLPHGTRGIALVVEHSADVVVQRACELGLGAAEPLVGAVRMTAPREPVDMALLEIADEVHERARRPERDEIRLFTRGEMEGSTGMIDKVFEHALRGDDPGRLAGYGFYMYWPEIKTAMRAELRP